LVEQGTENPRVGGSIPPLGTKSTQTVSPVSGRRESVAAPRPNAALARAATMSVAPWRSACVRPGQLWGRRSPRLSTEILGAMIRASLRMNRCTTNSRTQLGSGEAQEDSSCQLARWEGDVVPCRWCARIGLTRCPVHVCVQRHEHRVTVPNVLLVQANIRVASDVHSGGSLRPLGCQGRTGLA
jgi:hypothetical protein